jgi:hypothetical protein
VTSTVRVAALVAALVLATAACAVPGPLPTSGSAAPASNRAEPPKRVATVGRLPARTNAPAPTRLASQLEIKTLDESMGGAILEFASTGSAIIFSSNLAADADPEAAPDLWRVEPGPGEAVPELVWRNPARDHVLTRLTGDLDTVAFVDMPVSGDVAWDLWIVPRDGEPVLLDSHPGHPDVSGLVPSIAVYEPSIAWTAFDIGPEGPVSQLLTASAPDWVPRVLLERSAAEAELWLPSLFGDTIVFTEVVYAPDRQSDERHAYLWNIRDPTAVPERLDTSGLATMPQVEGSFVVWKEADRGFNMFNWGRLFRYDRRDQQVRPMHLGRHEYVNYPSLGSRFVAWWGSDTSDFSLYDLREGVARSVERYAPDGTESILRAHVADDLVAWLYVNNDPQVDRSRWELRYALLPNMKERDR